MRNISTKWPLLLCIALVMMTAVAGAVFMCLRAVDSGAAGLREVAASDLYLSKRSKSKTHHAEAKTLTFPVAFFGL